MLAKGADEITYAGINESSCSLVDEKVGHERYKATDEVPHTDRKGGNVHSSIRNLLFSGVSRGNTADS